MARDVLRRLPPVEESVSYIRSLKKPTTPDLLCEADRTATFLVQPRTGVGDHDKMIALLRDVDEQGAPDILSLTVDSYTRLLDLQSARQVLMADAARLNGYPVITHGYERVREINELFSRPIQVRHGSPDGRALFAVCLAGGLTSFEGGAIGYNLPYCKRVPLKHSLATWREIDELVGRLWHEYRIRIERELFGPLTAVLVPPSLALSMLFIEARLATDVGCPVLSLAYPQSGNLIQDVAALKVIRTLATRFLPPQTQVYPTLHQFMGVFPHDRQKADALIFLGGLTASLGRATKVINKTYQESIGVPDAQANIAGIKLTRMTGAAYFSALRVDEGLVQEEMYWLEMETRELIEDLLGNDGLCARLLERFSKGLLDIPFPSNPEARGEVIPVRDRLGAIRFANFGRLPFSSGVKKRNQELLGYAGGGSLHKRVRDGIMYFA
jgi:methylaspartate mutase epsilon subunit